MIKVIYRLSDNGYNKPKFPNATKMHCLENAMFKLLNCDWYLFVDNTNLKEDTRLELEKLNQQRLFTHFEYYTGGSSAGSFRYVMDFALRNFEDGPVYFLEDDYLHIDHSAEVIKEGLQIANYVSLYDHNDKYIPASQGGNPFIEDDAGEVTKVYRTKSTHWKLTNSTTMTFATTITQMRTDLEIWKKHISGTHPNDFAAFLELRDLGRSLITPIPGYSTHCEPAWASPGIDWSKV
jgi:hypothetical protein